MQILNDSKLMNIYGGRLIKNVIDYIRFIKYCIWEYFENKRYDRLRRLN